MAPVQSSSDSNEHTTAYAVNGLAITLAVISVALRFYTRLFTKSGLKVDDWLILVALITSLVTAVLVLIGNKADPNGIHVLENEDPNYAYTDADHLYLKLSFTCSVLYLTAAGATKLGILLMYHRIFAISTYFRYQLFAASSLVIGWWIGCTIAALRKCDPLEAGLFNTLNDPKHCFNFNVFWLGSGICEIFLDVWILTLPVGVVVRMRNSPRQKLVVSGIFMLGALSIITGIVKTILAYKPGRRSLSYANTEVWTALHTSIAILCASLPILRPLAKRIAASRFGVKLSSLFSRLRKSRSSQSGDGSESDQKRTETPPHGHFNLSFIASEAVQNILKAPNTVDPAPHSEPPRHYYLPVNP